MATVWLDVPSNFVSVSGISLAGVRVFHRDGVWYSGERMGLMTSGCRLPMVLWPELYGLADAEGKKIVRTVITSEKVVEVKEASVKEKKEKKEKVPKVVGKKPRISLYNPFAVGA